MVSYSITNEDIMRNIILPDSSIGGGREGRINDITADEITEILGFSPNVKDDPYKVVNSWAGTFNGQEFAIWDYKGSHMFGQFSTYGSSAIFQTLFGVRYTHEV